MSRFKLSIIFIMLGTLALLQLPLHNTEIISEVEAKEEDDYKKTSLVWTGDKAPVFTITDAKEKKFSLEEQRGKVVLVNFFATWCPPCREEMPYVQKLWEKHREDKNFVLMVIGREESTKTLVDFQVKNKYSMPIASDLNRKVYKLYAEKYIPRTYLIGPDGEILYAAIGFNRVDFEKMKLEIEKQLSSIKSAAKSEIQP